MAPTMEPTKNDCVDKRQVKDNLTQSTDTTQLIHRNTKSKQNGKVHINILQSSPSKGNRQSTKHQEECMSSEGIEDETVSIVSVISQENTIRANIMPDIINKLSSDVIDNLVRSDNITKLSSDIIDNSDVIGNISTSDNITKLSSDATHNVSTSDNMAKLSSDVIDNVSISDNITKLSSDMIDNVSTSDNITKLSKAVLNNLCIDDDAADEEHLIMDDGTAQARSGNIQNRVYTCPQCMVTFTIVKSYLHHLNDNHSMQFNIYECDLCDYATTYKLKLPRHRSLHPISEEADRKASYCDSLEKSPLTKVNINKPLQTSSQEDSLVKYEADDMDDKDDFKILPKDELSSSTPQTNTTDNVVNERKKGKKKTRQEVDPGRYFEAIDSDGTKYACSQCGNIYKWRKSLNKHWKEKHNTDSLLVSASPPGMVELLKSGKYTQMGARRIYDTVFLATIKTTNNVDTSCKITKSPSSLNKNKIRTAATSSLTSPCLQMLPTMIGPFLSSNGQPVFPGMPMALSHLSLHSSGCESPEEDALDLTLDNISASRNSPYETKSAIDHDHSTPLDQNQPLDFSKSSKSTGKDTTGKVRNDLNLAQSTSHFFPRQYQATKCDLTSTPEAELAIHTSPHLNKRTIRCYECKLQMNSVDELNNHFIQLHVQKLSEHKEAIKKIPHGLQQTYHILNMEIRDIGELGSKDLGTSVGKSLKCKKCDFEAKWPAELQKHAVSHSEERPYVCMVCGSTYKWKWDLVKHFQKSHANLPNPYRRNDKKDTLGESSEEDQEPALKRTKFYAHNDAITGSPHNQDNTFSVEGVMAVNQTGQRMISSQPKILEDGLTIESNPTFPSAFSYSKEGETAQTAQDIDRCKNVHKATEDAIRTQHIKSGSSSKRNEIESSSCSLGDLKPEELPYKCTMCNYHARWPSEVTQHMKNHSDSKPYLCPRCKYRSKWKWDVVKHLKRCGGGGGIDDVIDTTKAKKHAISLNSQSINDAGQQDEVQKMAPEQASVYTCPSGDEVSQQSSLEMGHINASCSSEPDRTEPRTPELNNSSNNNDVSITNNNINNNYTTYTSGLPIPTLHISTTSNIFSSKGNILPSIGSVHSSVSVSSTRASSSRQNSSRQTLNCQHCSFTTHSQAMLKRHLDLHLDDKPFKCDVCQYSTRWVCDLKKHRKCYNHYTVINNHIDGKEKAEKPRPRFNCSQCNVFFETLQNLLDHRLGEHVGQDSSHSSPATFAENEIDMARIKHPRKKVKKIQCHKCLFVCKSHQTMEVHMNEHKQLELNGISCFYCSTLFKDKESLLDHIITHSAFNPKEWETFFMITDEDQHLPNVDIKLNNERDHDSLQQPDIAKTEISHQRNHLHHKDTQDENTDADSSEVKIQQILNEIPKEGIAPQQLHYQNKFKCEWCSSEFVNLTAVYKHAVQAHPMQLKDQDNSMDLTDQTHLKLHGKGPSKKRNSGEPIDILKQQIEEKRRHQLAEKHLGRSSPQLQGILNKKMESKKGAPLYSCDKCNFISSNSTVYQYHCELHESRLMSQCWFCEYSVDNMNLLYQHMKISHTRKWKALSQDPKYATYIHRINLVFNGAGIHTDNIKSLLDNSHDTVDLGSKNKIAQPEITHEIMYITRQQYTWSGIPVNVVSLGNSVSYVCPHCAFQDATIADTCCHVMQCHRPMSKFTCKTCSFSDDNIYTMSEHCKKEHHPSERIVEVLNFKQINFNELHIVQLNALKEHMINDLSNKEAKLNGKSLDTKTMCCPFCPFKTLLMEHMKNHISDHSQKAKYQCHLCDFSSDSSEVISNHVKVHETGYTLDSTSLNKSETNVKKETIGRKKDESKMIARVQPIMGTMEVDRGDQEELLASKVIKKIRYRCTACPYHTICRSNILKHRRQHKNKCKYRCPKCSYGAARALLLKKHIESHESPIEGEGQHHDIFCDPNNPNGFENSDNDSGETDMNLDGDDDSEDVGEMDVKAIAKLEAKDILELEVAHKASILPEDVNSIDKQFRKLKCPHCPFSNISGSELRKHLHFHRRQERYKCDHCTYSLDRLNLLSQHRRLHAAEPHFNPNPPTTELLNTNFILQQTSDHSETSVQEDLSNNTNQFSCMYCPYKAIKKELFDVHFNSHCSRKCYICDFCDWSADCMKLMYQHRRVHTNEPTFNETPDDKIFLNQEYDDCATGEFESKLMEVKSIGKAMDQSQAVTLLSPQFKLTVVKKMYLCELCPYKTNSKISYDVHKNMHNSGSEYACTKCSYASVNSGLLLQHLLLHTAASVDVSAASFVMRNLPNKLERSDLEKSALNRETASSLTEPQDCLRMPDVPANSEMECQHYPFTTLSQSSLKNHVKDHISQESLKSLSYGFTTHTRQLVIPNTQINYPGPQLELEAMGNVLKDHMDKSSNFLHKFNNQSHDNVPFSPKPVVEEDPMKTKRVYVCQFCEREFEAKQVMIQHEKQHLVGSH